MKLIKIHQQSGFTLMSKALKGSKAFTLIEVLLYISILVMIILTTTGFIYLLLNSRVKNQTIAEVEQQGTQVMQIVTQVIRNSQSINSPADGSSGASLSLQETVSANDPTVFDLSGGVFRIKEGTGATVNLTNSQVTVSGLTFQNLAGSVKIQFTVTSVGNGNGQEFSSSQTFYGSANVRPN